MRITAFGGGHGLGASLRALKAVPGLGLTAVVTVADDGGAARALPRRPGGTPPRGPAPAPRPAAPAQPARARARTRAHQPPEPGSDHARAAAPCVPRRCPPSAPPIG